MRGDVRSKAVRAKRIGEFCGNSLLMRSLNGVFVDKAVAEIGPYGGI